MLESPFPFNDLEIFNFSTKVMIEMLRNVSFYGVPNAGVFFVRHFQVWSQTCTVSVSQETVLPSIVQEHYSAA